MSSANFSDKFMILRHGHCAYEENESILFSESHVDFLKIQEAVNPNLNVEMKARCQGIIRHYYITLKVKIRSATYYYQYAYSHHKRCGKQRSGEARYF